MIQMSKRKSVTIVHVDIPCREHKIDPQMNKGPLGKLMLSNLKKVRNTSIVGANSATDTEVVMVVGTAS